MLTPEEVKLNSVASLAGELAPQECADIEAIHNGRSFIIE
jgi:hypothetical protein